MKLPMVHIGVPVAVVLLNKKPQRGNSGVGYRVLEKLELCHTPPEHPELSLYFHAKWK